MTEKKLTPKEEAFCRHYVQCFNATESYWKIYKCERTTASIQGSKYLRTPHIMARIEQLKKEVMHDLFLEARDVLDLHTRIAFADITDYVSFGTDKNGQNYFHFKDSSQVDGQLVKKVHHGKEASYIQLHDKMKSLEFLSKYFGLLEDDEFRQLDKRQLELKNELLQKQLDRNGTSSAGNTYIISNEEAMREILNERSNAKGER